MLLLIFVSVNSLNIGISQKLKSQTKHKTNVLLIKHSLSVIFQIKMLLFYALSRAFEIVI